MTEDDLRQKAVSATKWSTLTEVAAKVIAPVTNMILARILAPEAFGVIAVVVMIVTFAEMLSDSGFQKYLVQRDFSSNEQKRRFADVAFWSNMVVAVVLGVAMVIFRDPIATAVGSPGLGLVIAVAAIQLPLTPFWSIQKALFARDFDFKTLFFARMAAVVVPFFVTIPLALLGADYWSLVVGAIVVQLVNAILLTVRSKWKPRFFFSLRILRAMLSFSLWSLVEAIAIWATSWVDVFIIARALTQYELGLYTVSVSMVNTLMAIITASTAPVLYSTLSRLKNDPEKFQNVYFTSQRLVAILILPIGVGIFVFRDFATRLFLGNQWGSAENIIGAWALSSAAMIVFGYYCSEVYRAQGRPKLSFIAQCLHLAVLVPTLVITAGMGFWVLVYARAIVRLQFVLVHFIIMQWVVKISTAKTLRNCGWVLTASGLMGLMGVGLREVSAQPAWTLLCMVLCGLFYIALLLVSKRWRLEVVTLVQHLRSGARSSD